MSRLSNTALLRLIALNAKISRVIELETQRRDPSTGTFRTGAAITPKAVRASWQLVGKRATDPTGRAFKTQLLAALRAPRK